MKSYTAYALEGFPMIKSEDDVTQIIINTAQKNGLNIENDDVVVIAQKILSKAENRIIRLRDVVPSKKAEELSKTTGKSPKFVELVLRETKKVLKVSRDILLVENTRDLVCINAGIDKSNIEGRGNFALLPDDPDKSAETCRNKIKKLTGKNVAVIVCDTYSRPFRRGQVNFAIGMAGIKPFKDYRRKRDLFNQILKVKNVAVVDEISSAAELLMGQAREATPVIIFKGLNCCVEHCEKCDTSKLNMPRDEDLFKDTL